LCVGGRNSQQEWQTEEADWAVQMHIRRW
jgi:hypothetical protein